MMNKLIPATSMYVCASTGSARKIWAPIIVVTMDEQELYKNSFCSFMNACQSVCTPQDVTGRISTMVCLTI